MNCGVCENVATLSWQRWAADDEVTRLHESEALPVDEDSAKLMVYGCDEHAIAPELAALTHESTCSAPPVCDCHPTA